MEDRKDIDYEFMAVWRAFYTRHNASFFEAFMYDRENLSDEDMKAAIVRVSEFLNLPKPVVQDKCETIAQVMTSENASECELYYNWQMMKRVGVNNKDSFTLAIAHEMSHQWLYPHRFMLFDNEMWIQEFAADMLVGGFSLLSGDVATGKYKYALSILSPSLTHPDGKLRAKIVENGRKYAWQLLSARRYHEVKDILDGLPAFVYSHYSELQESWDKVSIEDTFDPPFAIGSHVDIDSLPNNTIGPQLLEKYKNKLKEKQNESKGQ